MRPNFCEFIIEARKKKKLAQKDAAFKIGITPAQICNIENGVHFPSVDTLIKMSFAYDVSLDELLGIKRDNIITVKLGDIDSERAAFTRINRYHAEVIEFRKFKDANEREELLTPSLELFTYGNSICSTRLDVIKGKIDMSNWAHDWLVLLDKFDKTLKKRDEMERAGENTKEINKELNRQYKIIKQHSKK